MMTNWRAIIGYMLIFAAISEMIEVKSLVDKGEMESFPLGAVGGFILLVAAAFYLIHLGRNIQKEKNSGVLK